MAEGSVLAPLRDMKHLWLLVPALAWGGILVELVLPFRFPILPAGYLGCTLASVAIAILAFARKKKDIVSLCTPIFAFLIFVAPLETPPGLLIEVLYAATITALAVRLEKRFT
jgi:hypothetical protein